MILVQALLAAGAFVGTIIILRWLDARQLRDQEHHYLLHFPWGLEAEAVRFFLAGLSGIRPPWWLRLTALRAVVFETVGAPEGIRHHLIIPLSLEGVVLSHLRAAIPGVRLEHIEAAVAQFPTLAVELAVSTPQRPLRAEAGLQTSMAILASLQPLAGGESLVVQWILSPGPLQAAARRVPADGSQSLFWRLLRPRQPMDPQTAKELAAKHSEPLLLASGRVGVVAANRSRARRLLMQVLGAFHLANAPGVHLRRRLLPAWIVGSRLGRRAWPLLRWPCLLNSAETAGLLGLPLGEPIVAGLSLGASRQLPPPGDVSLEGAVVARSTYPGTERAIAIGSSDRLRHLHVLGPTGVGKSTLLLNLIAQDLAAGAGVVVLDPKSDLVSDTLHVIPTERAPDVIVLDPTDSERPVGFNPLRVRDEDRELMADQVTSIFATLFREFWGPRTDDILRAALLTLSGDPQMTLVEVVALLNDIHFRRRLVARIEDPILGSFWGWYEQLSPAERATAIGPVMNKLRAFLMRRKIRNVLGTADPALDFDELLAKQQVLLVPLSKGLLGEQSAALLGSLVLAQLWQATLGRAAIPASDRRPVMAHVDEFQDFFSLPTSIGDMLVQARSFGLGLTLAHQHMGQLPAQIRQGVLANARTKIVFQTTADDSRLLAREFEPYLKPSDLQGLGAYEVAIRLSTKGRVSTPMTGVTLPPPVLIGSGLPIRNQSRQRYGRNRAEIEADIRRRHQDRQPSQTIGRKPRQP